MAIAKQFNNIIERQLHVFAAWLPVTNTFKLGDYGIITDGVFVKMGNIKEFDVDISEGTGNESSIDFTSEGTRVINFAAGAQVDVIPEGAIDAKVTFKFDKEQSFIIKSPTINVDQMENVNEAGEKLMANPKWQDRFKVVHQTYLAKQATIISTIDAGTEVTLTGDAKALEKLNVGDASINLTSNNKLGLTIQGQEGVIGLGLFQIIKGGFLGIGGKRKVQVLEDEEESEQPQIQFLSAGEVEDDL